VWLCLVLLACAAPPSTASPPPARAPASAPVDGYRVAGPDVLVGPFTNRLAAETSPYLLQHAHNPVDWYPWGDAAFAEAKRRGVPVFLSIGYAACHWCHVMEEESFEDPATAAYLNANYVAIKVDREERPDVDGIYMDAVYALNGRGGWPASIWLDADRRPFFAGTYYPPESRLNRPGFHDVLAAQLERWRTDPADVALTAAGLQRKLDASAVIVPVDPVNWGAADDGVAWMEQGWDAENPGWGAKKFPMVSRLEYLLAYGVTHRQERALRPVRQMLHAMDRGGIHDQLGGGFHRYTVDPAWTVPHFEKMTYDNGQLLRIYAEAAVALDEPRFAAVARGVATYLLREMRHPDGSFSSSQDADTEGEEGTTYTWTPGQVRGVLGDGARPFLDAYGVTSRGNFEHGTSVLTRRTADASPFAEPRAALLAARVLRPQPPTDTKRVVAYNALAIGGLARAGRLLHDPELVTAAARAAEAVLAARHSDGGLPRTLEPGSPAGVIDDYAWFAEALLDLYEADPDPRWLVAADSVAAILTERFWDPVHGGFFFTEVGAEGLLVRQKELSDGARPSGSGRAVAVLRRLRSYGAPSGSSEHIQRGLEAAARYLRRSPGTVSSLLVVVDALSRPSVELIVATPDRASAQPFVDLYNAEYRPHAVLAVVRPADLEALADFSGIAGKHAGADGPLAYVCFDGTCEQPTQDLRRVRLLLARD
jgi:uncharacterized protein YyaL (SSP411 family)